MPLPRQRQELMRAIEDIVLRGYERERPRRIGALQQRYGMGSPAVAAQESRRLQDVMNQLALQRAEMGERTYGEEREERRTREEWAEMATRQRRGIAGQMSLQQLSNQAALQRMREDIQGRKQLQQLQQQWQETQLKREEKERRTNLIGSLLGGIGEIGGMFLGSKLFGTKSSKVGGDSSKYNLLGFDSSQYTSSWTPTIFDAAKKKQAYQDPLRLDWRKI